MLVFQAYHYSGTEVSYHWEFGDGQSVTRTTTDKVDYIYDRLVVVMVEVFRLVRDIVSVID